MSEYLKGEKLYGNDFSIDQIKKWYNDESEGYADLGSKNKGSYKYTYHALNKIHGFSKINESCFENVLGLGSAWGYEFEPIISKIKRITIIEPSEKLINNKIGHITPQYIKPNENGTLIFEDNTFDLITCFGTLHHIPNVSFVLNELIRVLKPNGHLLIRETITSMGDWQKPRRGLTKNERGIPVSFFDSLFESSPVNIVSKTYCFTLTSLIQKKIGHLFKKEIYSYDTYILFDRLVSKILKKNVQYHPISKFKRIAPQSIFYVVKKVL